jgi:hypothetical protein
MQITYYSTHKKLSIVNKFVVEICNFWPKENATTHTAAHKLCAGQNLIQPKFARGPPLAWPLILVPAQQNVRPIKKIN